MISVHHDMGLGYSGIHRTGQHPVRGLDIRQRPDPHPEKVGVVDQGLLDHDRSQR